jgi:integrase
MPTHLLTLYRKLSEDGARRDGKKGGYSSATIRHHHNLIHVIFDRAVKWQIIASNPADNVDSPKRRTESLATYYDEEQSMRLLSCLKDEPIKYQLALSIGIAMALRRGEAIGLRWSDIDLENCVISVNQSYEYKRKEGSGPKSTKTMNSQQKVSFPASLAPLFREYKEWQDKQKDDSGAQWVDTGYLFTQWNGEVMSPDTLTQYMPKFTQKYNLPHLDFKGLRHTCASLLIANGADVSVVSRHLRHAQKSTTLNIYTHEFNRANKEAANIIETALPFFKKDSKNHN